VPRKSNKVFEKAEPSVNVIGFRDVVYAIPQVEGAFDLARIHNGAYSRSFHGPDVETVMAAVQRELGVTAN
jgi:hypothetical protein